MRKTQQEEVSGTLPKGKPTPVFLELVTDPKTVDAIRQCAETPAGYVVQGGQLYRKTSVRPKQDQPPTPAA